MKNDFLRRLADYARRIPEPDNLFSGRVVDPAFRLPDNILIFYHDFSTPLPNAHGRHTLVIPFSPMIYFIDGRRIVLAPGDLLYVPPYAVRFMHPDSAGYRRLFITFDLSGPQKYLPPSGAFPFTPKSEAALRRFLRQYETAGPEHAAFALMDLLLLQCGRPPEKISGKPLPAAVAKVIELVDTDLARIGGIKDLAERAGLSESHLRQLFRRYAGLSLGRFILGKKLDYAKYQLACSEKRIAEIAAGCGFANIYVFSAFFRRNTGESPLRFRKAHVRTNSSA